MEGIRFEVDAPSDGLNRLREEVRDFLAAERAAGRLRDAPQGAAIPDPDFSRALGRRGWIGMTWPRRYGGHERRAIERHVVTEELLAGGAPVRAHWIADRQSGPLILHYGTEAQRQTYLPRIASGECFFCIGMSEADSGSDLASIRTRARKVDGGWRVDGAKLWTSNAHRVHMMILFARTAPANENRRHGVTQFLVDLAWPGITVRPIVNLAGEHDFNEVVFDDVFVPDDMRVGTVDQAWSQVSSELAYERSGPDRWLSTYALLARAVGQGAGADSDAGRQQAGRLAARLWTLHQLSMSVAGMMEQGIAPAVEAALVKELGTAFERDVPETVRLLLPEDERPLAGGGDLLADSLQYATLYAPAYTIRGGTREILRGIVAKSLGLR